MTDDNTPDPVENDPEDPPVPPAADTDGIPPDVRTDPAEE